MSLSARLSSMFVRAVLISFITIITACSTTGNHTANSDKPPPVDLFMVSINAQKAYQQSRWLDAVRYYQKIIEHVPNDAIAWFRLANTYAQQGAFEPAIHAYQQSLNNDSAQPKAWFNLSTAYLLSAQSAMHNAQSKMQRSEPASIMIDERLQTLGTLIHGPATQLESAGARKIANQAIQ